MPPKNWIDQHFGQQTPTKEKPRNAAPPPPPPRRSLGPLLGTSVTLGFSCGIIALDYSGIYPLGIKQYIDSLINPPVSEVIAHEPPPKTTPPPQRPIIRPQPEPEPEPEPIPEKIDTTDKNQQAARARRIKQIDSGITMLTNDLNKNRVQHNKLQTDLTARTPPRSKPWTSAEVILEAQEYLQQTDLSVDQRFHATTAISDARARIKNAHMRMKELNELQLSLQKRIDKLTGEKKALMQ